MWVLQLLMMVVWGVVKCCRGLGSVARVPGVLQGIMEGLGSVARVLGVLQGIRECCKGV